MHPAFVDHFAFELGEQEYSVHEAEAMGNTLTDAKALAGAGFARHRICRQETSAYDLARRAVEKLGTPVDDVNAIIYATCLTCNGNLGKESLFRRTRDVKHLMDFPVSHLQADLGMDNAAAIGLNQQACTSMLGSLRLARALLRDDPDVRRVLCLTADRFPAGAVYEQAYNLISDGAAACVVSDVPGGYRIVSCHAITNGALARATDEETVGAYFNYTVRLIHESLLKAKLTIEDIDWVVPQNTNIKAWQILSRLLRIDLDRVHFASIGDVGHIISCDNVVNLMGLEKAVSPPAGSFLLLVMAGFGLNWQSVILEKV